MDPLRQDVKRLMVECPAIILEHAELVELLDGYVDRVIEKHKAQDETFSRVIAEEEAKEPIVSIEPVQVLEPVLITDQKPVDAKQDMADNGVIDTQQYTLVMAQQIISAFENGYDEDVLKDIETLRTKKSKKARREVREYDETLAIVNQLKRQHNLE